MNKNLSITTKLLIIFFISIFVFFVVNIFIVLNITTQYKSIIIKLDKLVINWAVWYSRLLPFIVSEYYCLKIRQQLHFPYRECVRIFNTCLFIMKKNGFLNSRLQIDARSRPIRYTWSILLNLFDLNKLIRYETFIFIWWTLQSVSP